MVYDALEGITQDPMFLDYRDAMIAADNDFYNGAHSFQIQSVFDAAGITDTEPPASSVVATISGPGVRDSGQQGTWTAGAQGGTGSYSYQWYYKNPGSSSFQSGGTSITYTHAFNNSGSSSVYGYIKVVVSSGSEQAEDVKLVVVNPDDCPPGFICS